MFRNYLLVALRHLRKQKGYAAINVLGLSIGIAGALLVALFVRQELAFDDFHDAPENVFRTWGVEVTPQGGHFENAVTPYVLGPTMAATLPEVEAFTRFQPSSDAVRVGEDAFVQTVALVDSGFFDVFSFPLLRGDPATALARPDGVVLVDSVATKLFGDTDPIGQRLTLRLRDQEQEATVTGVVRMPEASSLRFDVLVPFGAVVGRVLPEAQMQNWFAISTETWVRLRDGTSAEAVEAKLPAIITAHRTGGEGTYTVHLQPLLDVHLNADMPRGISRVRDPQALWVLGLFALVVLAIACINFTTLALGQSLERAREVGVRKALGAYRTQLMGQFWGEAALLTGLALVGGIGLTGLGLPLLSRLVEQPVAAHPDAVLVLIVLGIVVLTALGAGAYPALVLARFQPTETLRGRFRLGGGGGVQRGLVAVQFAFSIALVASTFVMGSQLRYLQTRDLGYVPDRVVRLPNVVPGAQGMDGLAAVRASLERESAVEAVSAAAYPLGTSGLLVYDDEHDTRREFRFNEVASDFLETMQIRVSEGTSFSAEPATAAHQAVVNRAFVEAFGLEAPVGQPLPDVFNAYTIVGVTEDFNFETLHERVGPLVLFTDVNAAIDAADGVGIFASSAYDVFVRLRPGPLPAQMQAIERAFSEAVPGLPFDYEFLDDALDQQYRDEAGMMTIVRLASILAILIAALGLFGLAALTAEQRRKEIGVRKVLGASVGSIVVLLSKDLARLVLAGFVVAAPVAYWLMQGWLENFAYHVRLGPALFVASGLVALGVALTATFIHSLRAATMNPVKSLRSE